jgi:hypothetical protein
VEAVIIILKHATLLRLLNLSPESALAHAELDYREANVDLKIQQHLAAFSQDHSLELFVSFIMATDIGLSILASFKMISHQVCTESTHRDPDLLLSSQYSHLDRKDHWFKRFWEPLRNTRKDT